jgi:hypothetical protein
LYTFTGFIDKSTYGVVLLYKWNRGIPRIAQFSSALQLPITCTI